MLLWLLADVGLSAQVPQFRFQHLGKEEGLANNTGNYFISEDSRGFIWISSLNGFYRYDGLELKHFLIPVNEGDAFISGQLIQSGFWEDRHGNLWFTTYNALHCLNRQRGAISNFRVLEANGQKADHSYHIFHKEEGAGRLWLRAGGQVWAYDTEGGRWEAQFPSQSIRFCAIPDDSGEVRTIIACLWLKGPVTVSCRKDDGSWISEDYLDAGLEVRSALVKSDSTAWLFSKTGLLEFNFLSGNLLAHYTHTQENIALDLFAGIYEPEGRFLLLATHSNGLLAFDTQKKCFVRNWKREDRPTLQLASDSPRALFWSKAGQLWIGHKQNGVDFTRFSQGEFRNPLSSDLKASAAVSFIMEDNQKNIWALTGEGMIYRSAEGRAPLAPFRSPPAKSPIIHIGTGHSEAIWAITNRSAYRLKDQAAVTDEKWEQVFSSPKELVSVFLGIPGRILLITREGVFDLLEVDGKYVFRPSEEFKDYPGFHFYHFYKLSDEVVLIPFESNELWVARIEEKKLTISEKLEIGGDTYSGCLTPSGDSIWVGANIGLMLYAQKKITRVLQSAERLDGAAVFGVIGTKPGYLWLSTSLGLKRFQYGAQQLTSFYQDDGLSSDQFSPYAHLIVSDGRLWLGNNQGLTVFHPDSIRAATSAPRVHIEAFWVNNVPFETETAISELDALNLGYLENTLSFELKAVNFHQAGSNSLAYRLLNYDDNWASAPNGGYARFTKIPPGQYTLEILPLNANGQAGPKHSLAIGIHPPFWQTLWFKTSSVLAVLLLVAGIVGAYYRRKLLKQRELLERQQALNEERNRIAKELHDDMGSSLSSILFLSEDLLLDEDSGQKHEVQRISSLAESSLENMREIIWAMDTDKNTLQDLSARLRAFATDFLTDNKARFELDFPVTSMDLYVLGGERRRNIYLIAKEALHNAVKHAQAKQVRVALKLEEQQIVLEIQEDGRGFDEQALASAGHGLNNMRGRAEAIGGRLQVQSAPGVGTLLCLSVPL